MGRRGPRKLSVAELKRRGTYRQREHGDREEELVISAPLDHDIEPPAGFSAVMKAFFQRCYQTIALQPHQLLLLEQACWAYDRAESARAILDEEGLTFVDRFGQPRPRPEATIEHHARMDFSKLCRDAGLDDPQKMLRAS